MATAGLGRRILKTGSHSAFPIKEHRLKHKFIIIWIALAIILILSAVLLSTRPSAASSLPFSSYSASDDGAKAAYLLLFELGFKVDRKTVSFAEYEGGGLVIALGAEYLAETGHDLVIENSVLFTNFSLRYNAKRFLEIMYPYKDRVIVFDEYGREPNITMRNIGEAELPGSVWDIMPSYMQFLFFGLCFLIFIIMFFYKQRVGEAQVPEGFSGRSAVEGISAMANTMFKARVFKDCSDFYFKYQAGKSIEWDKEGIIKKSLESVNTEREALALMVEMDKNIAVSKQI
jgi:hypothetical protein